MHSALHYYAAGDPGDLVDVSGAAVLESSSHRAAAQELLAFLVSRTARRRSPAATATSTRCAPASSAAPGLRPLAQLQPAPLTPAELGDGSAALALEQKLGLL